MLPIARILSQFLFFYSLFVFGEGLHGRHGSREDHLTIHALACIIRSQGEERSQSPHQCHCPILSIKLLVRIHELPFFFFTRVFYSGMRFNPVQPRNRARTCIPDRPRNRTIVRFDKHRDKNWPESDELANCETRSSASISLSLRAPLPPSQRQRQSDRSKSIADHCQAIDIRQLIHPAPAAGVAKLGKTNFSGLTSVRMRGNQRH